MTARKEPPLVDEYGLVEGKDFKFMGEWKVALHSCEGPQMRSQSLTPTTRAQPQSTNKPLWSSPGSQITTGAGEKVVKSSAKSSTVRNLTAEFDAAAAEVCTLSGRIGGIRASPSNGDAPRKDLVTPRHHTIPEFPPLGGVGRGERVKRQSAFVEVTRKNGIGRGGEILSPSVQTVKPAGFTSLGLNIQDSRHSSESTESGFGSTEKPMIGAERSPSDGATRRMDGALKQSDGARNQTDGAKNQTEGAGNLTEGVPKRAETVGNRDGGQEVSARERSATEREADERKAPKMQDLAEKTEAAGTTEKQNKGWQSFGEKRQKSVRFNTENSFAEAEIKDSGHGKPDDVGMKKNREPWIVQPKPPVQKLDNANTGRGGGPKLRREDSSPTGSSSSVDLCELGSESGSDDEDRQVVEGPALPIYLTKKIPPQPSHPAGSNISDPKVLRVDCPARFWIQTDVAKRVAERVNNMITNQLSKRRMKPMSTAYLDEGRVCVVKHGEMYKRARVMSVNFRLDLVELELIDSAEKIEIRGVSEIKPLKNQNWYIPAQVNKCCLALPGSTADMAYQCFDTTEQQNEEFREFLENKEPLLVKVLENDKENQCSIVEVRKFGYDFQCAVCARKSLDCPFNHYLFRERIKATPEKKRPARGSEGHKKADFWRKQK